MLTNQKSKCLTIRYYNHSRYETIIKAKNKCFKMLNLTGGPCTGTIYSVGESFRWLFLIMHLIQCSHHMLILTYNKISMKYCEDRM